MKMSNYQGFRFLLIGVIFFLTSCRAYKQDILFRLDEDFTAQDLALPVAQAEKNYVINPGDLLDINVFTNKGERLVDPNFELGINRNQQNMQNQRDFQYLVRVDGLVKVPVIGDQRVGGLTIHEAELLLEEEFNIYYKESFVKLSLSNRRVVVLGANGGQVVPIQNENTSLIEVLALYGGLNLGANAGNIKLIRGDLNHPEVYLIDLSSLDGMQASIVPIEAGDIIYVEPWRRAWIESLRDVSPVLSLAASVLTLIVVVQNLGK